MHAKRAEGIAQELQHEALSSNSNTGEKKKERKEGRLLKKEPTWLLMETLKRESWALAGTR
jgi:hypothetical protein